MKGKDETAEQRQIATLVEGLTTALARTSSVVSATIAQPSNPGGNRSVASVADTVATSLTSSLSGASPVTRAIEDSIQKLSGPLGFLATLNPIVAGLSKLFGGGGTSELPVLPKYERPDPMRLNAGVSESDGWTARGVDYAASGLPRTATQAAMPPQIVVQVQAMDSRSFLDRRDDIAAAVRQALLESHSLNDVMSER